MDTQERDRLIGLIIGHVADYRQDEIPRVDAARVLSWLQQFEDNDRPIILVETERMLSKTYISRARAKSFIERLAANEELAGDSPKDFWKAVGFLGLQSGSRSQTDMLTLLDEVLADKFGLSTASENSVNNTYVYLDDVSFSGNQIKNDLLQWFEQNKIKDANVQVIVIGVYAYGEYYAKRELRKAFNQRNTRLKFWASVRIENSPNRVKDAGVLWPTQLPNEKYVKQWEATLAPHKDYFIPRPPDGAASTRLFTSEANREVVEQAFLKKGAYIFSLPKNPQASMRPLGFSALRTPGFGATLITYRNCPNNAPLVLWWGDPEGSAPLNQWTPLLQRRPRARGPGADSDVTDL
jgi:hypothetical protein